MENIRKRFIKKGTSVNSREMPQLRASRKIYDASTVIRRYCRTINMDESEICRRGKGSIERAMLMELLYRCCNLAQPEIGRLVGGLDYSSVSVARKRLRLQM